MSSAPAKARILAVLATLLVVIQAGTSQTFTTLYNFGRHKDGHNPTTSVVLGGDGTICGTTSDGGAHGRGSIFAVAPDGTEKVLFSFDGKTSGADPVSGPLLDSQGNLYGTTWKGPGKGRGSVFKLDTAGTLTTLHGFSGGNDGGNPNGALLLDKTGNLYGTTFYGGIRSKRLCEGRCGVIYKIAPDGSETVLYSFPGGAGGSNPSAGLIMDSNGRLYGTTFFGGTSNAGTVFRLSGGTLEILYSFTGGVDGGNPGGELIQDQDGNLYGGTMAGGDLSCPLTDKGCGVIFKLSPGGQLTVLYTFKGSDGDQPRGGVVRDGSGNLFGTTPFGGVNGDGTVFEISHDGSFQLLHSFDYDDGIYADGALVRDGQGSLYGTTASGGTSNEGTVFEITPN